MIKNVFSNWQLQEPGGAQLTSETNDGGCFCRHFIHSPQKLLVRFGLVEGNEVQAAVDVTSSQVMGWSLGQVQVQSKYWDSKINKICHKSNPSSQHYHRKNVYILH